MVTAMCMKCTAAEKKKGKADAKVIVDIKNPQVITNEKGRKMTKGVCPNCSGNVFSFKVE